MAAACYDDQYECAKLLIENNVSLHSLDTRPPIYFAARHSGVLCLGLLIESGVDVNSVCMAFTPLYEAVSAQNLPGCKMLLSRGNVVETFALFCCVENSRLTFSRNVRFVRS